MGDRVGREDCPVALATNFVVNRTFKGDILDWCPTHQDGETERQSLRRAIDQDQTRTENCASIKRECDARQQESVVPGTAATCSSLSILSEDDDTSTTQGSSDREVPTPASIDQISDARTFADGSKGCNQCRGVRPQLVEPVANPNIPKSILSDGATQLRSTQSHFNGESPATLSSRDHRCSDLKEQNLESLPADVPTAGASVSRVPKELIDGKTASDEIIGTTYLEPSVSQSAKSERTTHSGITEWHANRTSCAVSGHTSSVPSDVGTHSSTGQVPLTPLPDDVVATWERALAVTLASSTYSSTSPMETLSSGMTKTSNLHVPSSRLSTVMCRSNDAVQIQGYSCPEDRTGGDLGSSFGFGSPSKPVWSWLRERAADDVVFSGPHRSKPWLASADRKRSKACGRFALFALVVSLVVGVTVVGAVFASRGSPSSSASPSQRSCDSNAFASSLFPELVRESKEDNRNGIVVLQEWHSSLKSAGTFGDFVAASKYGSVMAIAERVNNTASAVYILSATSRMNLPAVNHKSVVFFGAVVTSLALNNDGTVLAVGLSTGVTEIYNQDDWCTSQWRRMGDSIRQHEVESPRQSSLLANYTTSVSISGDGTVVAVGLVTSSNAARYQVLRFHKGGWQPKGPAIEYGDDGSYAHTSATVSLSANCTTELTSSCILATSRMFSYEQFSFGMVSVRKTSPGDTSWDALGQAIPLALEEATVEIASNGTTLSVSDAASTTVYSLGTMGGRVEWVQLGQHVLPRASSVAIAGSGGRLALSANKTVVVYEFRQDSSSGSNDAPDWNKVQQFPSQSAREDNDLTGSSLRLAIGHRGDRLVVGDPFFPTNDDESSGRQGRVLVIGL